MKRLNLRALAWSALAFPLLACGPTRTGDVTIGAAGAWTTSYGAMDKRGIDLAVEEINRSTLLGGRTLRVMALDDESDGAKATKVAQTFVGNPNVVGVVGHVTSGAMVAAAKVYDGNLAAIATTATSPDLTAISPWVFRVIPSDSANGLQIAKFCARLGRRRAAVLYENDSYGRGLAAAFVRNFEGDVVSDDPIAADGKDVEVFVSFLKEKKPDVVFVAGTDVSGTAVMREARRAGLAADFVGGDGWSTIADASAEGAYVGVPFTVADPRPEAQRFVKAFRTKFGVDPDQTAAAAYDATQVLVHAIARAGNDRRSVREYLASMKPADAYAGVTGSIRFGADGDPVSREVVMSRFEHGTLALAAAP